MVAQAAATMSDLRAKLDAVRALQQRIHVVPSPSHWTTSTPAPSPPPSSVSSSVASRSSLPTFPSLFDGGIASLGGMEYLVIDFFSIPDLLVGAMVCKRWRDMCRHDGFWEKLLVTPVEGYALRPLLACADSVPAMCVHMLFCQSGLRMTSTSDRSIHRPQPIRSWNWSTHPKSIHVTSSCDGKTTLPAWLANNPGPLLPDVVRSLCFQVLHAIVALEDCIGAKPRELTLQRVAVASATAVQAPASLDATASDTLPYRTRPPLVQLLAVDSHVESCDVPSAQYFDEREEAIYLLKYRGLPKKSQKWRGVTVAYLYLVLALSLHGHVTAAQIQQMPAMSILHALAEYRHVLPRDIREFVEYGVFVRYHQTSPKPFLWHTYFTSPHVGDASADSTIIADDHPLLALQFAIPATTYMERILQTVAWQEALQTTMMNPRRKWPSMSPPVWNDEWTLTPIRSFHQQWLRQQWHSLSLAPDSTPASLALLLLTQKPSLRRLDLMAATRLSSDTIVRALAYLPLLRELRLPLSMLRHGPLEAVVEALDRSSVHVVDPAMAIGLCALEKAYLMQIDMLAYSSSPSKQ